MKVSECREKKCEDLERVECYYAKKGHVRTARLDKIQFGYPCEIRYLADCPKNLNLTEEERERLAVKMRYYETGWIDRSSNKTER